MKRLRLICYFILSLDISTSCALDIYTGSGSQDDEKTIKKFIGNFSSSIAEHCNFATDLPIYTPLNDSDLMEWLAQPGESEDVHQYLLLKPHYHIDNNISLSHKAKFCGLHDWLAFGILLFSETLDIVYSLNTDLSDDEAHSSGVYPFASGSSNNRYYDNKSVTRISFTPANQEAPSLLLLKHSEFRHLGLYQEGEASKYGLLAVGCHISGYCQTPGTKVTLTLEEVTLEDQSGISDFLLKVDDGSELYAKNAVFNFRHNSSASAALCLYWTRNLQVSDTFITNSGDRGSAVYWAGFYELTEPAYFVNTVISSSQGSDITGFELLYDSNLKKIADYYTALLPRFSGITLNPAISTGFSIDNFPVRQNGHSNNVWNSNGVRCTGSDYKCSLIFNDGTSSLATIPVPVTTPIPASTSSPVATLSPVTTTAAASTPALSSKPTVPETDTTASSTIQNVYSESGAVHLTHRWQLIAGMLLTLLTTGD